MRLSSKVLVLWGVRIFLIPLPFIPLLEKCFDSKFLLWSVYIISASVVFGVFYIKYRTCTILVSSSGLSLSSGYFIRKHLYIKHRHILAATKVSTPLSQKLKLCNLVLYCEGSTFILPPLKTDFTEQIRFEIQRTEESDET